MFRKENQPRPIVIFAVIAILVTALILRLWGIRFGLPFAYHVDEPTYISAALNLGSGIVAKQPNPTGFSNFLFGEYALYYILGRMSGSFSSVADFAVAYRTDVTAFLLFSRVTSAIFGALTVLPVYWTGTAIRNRIVGLLGSLFLATTFSHVRDSHYGVPDITATFLVSLSVLLCILVLQRPEWRILWLAAVFVGLTIATKWSLWPVVIPFAMALYWHLRNKARAEGTRLWSAVGVTLGCLAIGAALGGFQLFLRPSVYFEYALREMRAGEAGGFGNWLVDTVPGWVYYPKTLSYGLGSILFVIALVGLTLLVVRAVRNKEKVSIVLLSFPLAYFVVMGASRHYFARYALPLVPFAVIFAAYAIWEIAYLFSLRSQLLGRTAAVGLTVVALIQPAMTSIRHDILLTRMDTRTAAKYWIESNLSSGAKIAIDWPFHGPPLMALSPGVRDNQPVFDVTFVGGTGLSEHPLSWYRENDFDYLVASSNIYQIPLVYPKQDAQRRTFYSIMDQELDMVHIVRPNDSGGDPAFIFDEIYGPIVNLWMRDRPGPTLKIYRVSQ